MKSFRNCFIFIILLSSCGIFTKNSTLNDHKHNERDVIQFTILQINDFYEIAPFENGTLGGAARIATIRKKLLAENKNSLTVLAGDFLSPTLLGTLKWEGKSIKGRQMVDVLNKVGVDVVTFGNHEFDIDETSLQNRINESTFDWVSTNVSQVKGSEYFPFKKEVNGQSVPIPKNKIISFKNTSGKEIRIGIVAPCLPANKVNYVHYDDIFESVRNEIKKLEGQVDFILALSHLTKEDDLKMAKMFPEINLITGGHEHENMKYVVGKTILTKADANAKTVYVHRIRYQTKTKKSTIQSSLVKLDKSIALDGEVNVVVEKWKSIENKIVREMGFDPDQILIKLNEPYDAREITIRNMPAPFCQMIGRSMSKAVPSADCAITNSGSVRVDDMLKDNLSQYDILRSLPFGGGFMEVDMKGSLLKKILDIGWNNKGSGGFLQWDNIRRNQDSEWYIRNTILETNKIYHVAISSFLMTGKEAGLDMLTPKNPDIVKVIEPNNEDPNDLRRDIRFCIIDYLKKGGR
ncbi:MAG: bifunctional metallophosphatase/5'-nucleotidase [Bacteroidota bacterium]|nr:bifunctional metallophosphatase/5'-nucleotidase [Bacteroidota bacterium]